MELNNCALNTIQYAGDDIICYKGNSYKIVSNETKILNHWYLAVIPYTDKKEEGVEL